ncbi:MAG: hypothetical protein A2007_03875 [Verrucomicrobia bacterium GWC2_42_7]|nr:MAG: hypothetical protein A2007_03875 [Verrucomicrobia bacterium GWC2_42_7]
MPNQNLAILLGERKRFCKQPENRIPQVDFCSLPINIFYERSRYLENPPFHENKGEYLSRKKNR